jgi:hypothetical protein
MLYENRDIGEIRKIQISMMSRKDIINWLKSKRINLISDASGYIFEVGFRGEYASGTPEILLHEDELDTLSNLGKIIGVIYHDKDKVIRITVRHKNVI